MSRLRFALVLGAALLAVSAYMRIPSVLSASTTANGPALQVTASIAAPTPVPEAAPSSAAPIGEGTQSALLIVGLVVLSALLIGGGIYLRQRWMATRY
ncbi:MAG: hypothetical protein ACJ8CR_27070 [Roseiflexaceae bacterium]